MLTEKELVIAKKLIANTASGQYKLKNLYGAQWKNNKSPTTFGKQFKASVIQGHLPSAKPVAKDGDNAWMYQVN